MNHKKLIRFFIVGLTVIGSSAVACPSLNLPPTWTLEKNEIHVQGQRWYVYQFWTNVTKPSGGDLPVNNDANELLAAKQISFLDKLDPEARNCRYSVVKKDSTPAELVIKRIGD